MHRFTGKAKCYNSEEEAEEAILGGKIEKGDVVVIRYEGPKGGPGMREMFKAMKYMYGMGLAKSAALITDGRFSGTNNGCFVGHISPEAAEGGPLAIVEDGDEISIDVIDGKLELHVSDEEMREERSMGKTGKTNSERLSQIIFKGCIFSRQRQQLSSVNLTGEAREKLPHIKRNRWTRQERNIVIWQNFIRQW